MLQQLLHLLVPRSENVATVVAPVPSTDNDATVVPRVPSSENDLYTPDDAASLPSYQETRLGYPQHHQDQEKILTREEEAKPCC